jgi:hypothetical protein
MATVKIIISVVYNLVTINTRCGLVNDGTNADQPWINRY